MRIYDTIVVNSVNKIVAQESRLGLGLARLCLKQKCGADSWFVSKRMEGWRRGFCRHALAVYKLITNPCCC